jgi:hypothetical protein
MECKIEGCKSKATYGFKFAQPELCIKHGRVKGAKTQYGVCKCGASTPRFALPDEKASCCAKCKVDGMQNIGDRRCVCKKHLPSFGLPTDKRPNYCGECKTPAMVSLKGRKCPCGKKPCFGFEGKDAVCCAKCKEPSMKNLVSILCPCGKYAVFGMKADKKPSCCVKCKSPAMENIVSERCKCSKALPVFGYKGTTKRLCCISCKTDSMVNVAHKLCKCGKAQPTLGFKTDKTPTCCSACKQEGMCNILDKKCKCGKQPVFGLKGDKTATCCASCRSPAMVNIKAKMCKCGRAQPVFGLRTDKKATCCVACKTQEMLDIVSEKCRGLINYQGRGDQPCPYESRCKAKYDNYCTKCFQQNFPDDPRSLMIYKNSHESAVKAYLASEFEGFIHNTSLWTGQEDCTCRRRIDFRMLIGNTLLCIEVDEDQHKYRDKEDELKRYDDLMMMHGGKFIFIRYNPHVYLNEEGKRKNPEFLTRMNTLKESILNHMERIQEEENEDLVEIEWLFFDEV